MRRPDALSANFELMNFVSFFHFFFFHFYLLPAANSSSPPCSYLACLFMQLLTQVID